MINMRKIGISILIILGVMFVFLWQELSSLYFFIILVSLIIMMVARNKSNPDRKFLISLIIFIFVSRFFISLVLMHVKDGELVQDEGLYSKKALMKTYGPGGFPEINTAFFEYYNDRDMLAFKYGNTGYTQILFWFYRIFGYQIQAVRLINVIVAIFAFLCVYYLARALFGRDPARIASLIYAFFPSQILWSVMICVDLIIVFGILLGLLSMVRMIKGAGLYWLIPLLFSIVVIGTVRLYIMQIFIGIVVITGISVVVARLTKKAKLTLALVIFLLSAVYAAPCSRCLLPVVKNQFYKKMGVVIRMQHAFAYCDDSGYLIYPSYAYSNYYCNLKDLPLAYAKGMYHVIFSPFPWKVESKLQLMAYPQTIIWYILIPFFVYGFVLSFKKDALNALPVYLFMIVVFSIFAFIEGNIGALFRHKDMVTPLLIIYSGLGIYAVLDRKGEREGHPIPPRKKGLVR